MRLYTENGKLVYQFDRNNYGGRGFALRILVRGGAGIVNGYTVYLAWDSGSRRYARRFQGLRCLGVTRNANRVPYAAIL